MAFPATFKSIQDAVIAKARLDAAADLAKVKDWINQVYTQVCVEAESTSASTTLTLVAGQPSYTLNATIARILQMYLVLAGQTAVVGEQPPLTLTTLDDIFQRRRSGGLLQQAGAYSTHYALAGRSMLEFWPTPAAADVITIYYIGFPTALSLDADVPVLDEPYASKLLEFGALVEAGDFKGDPATSTWQAEYADWMGRYLNHLEEKKGDPVLLGHQWGSLDDPFDDQAYWYGY